MSSICQERPHLQLCCLSFGLGIHLFQQSLSFLQGLAEKHSVPLTAFQGGSKLFSLLLPSPEVLAQQQMPVLGFRGPRVGINREALEYCVLMYRRRVVRDLNPRHS